MIHTTVVSHNHLEEHAKIQSEYSRLIWKQFTKLYLEKGSEL